MKKIFILLLCGAALLACKKEDQNGGGGGGEPQLPVSVVGTVKGDDGTLLEGVIVSDGHVCVKTDASGHYELPANLSKAMYVWVSTPSGYAAPVTKGQAIFFKKIAECSKDSGGRSVADFTLKKISNPNKFTIFIYADPQPRGHENWGIYDGLAYESLDCCEDMYDDMQELKASITDQPVYGIGLGDIVHIDISLLDRHKTGMARTGISNYNIIGNHDQQHVQGLSDEESWKEFGKKMGPVNYSFNLGNMHFLMLDNMISPGASDPTKFSDECPTGFTKEIWEFIQNDLATVTTDKTIMVCAHSPMMHYVSGGSVSERSGNYCEQLRGLLKRYPKAYVWAGHTHCTFNKARDNEGNELTIETHTLTRVTGALWTNEYLGANGTPRGYLVFKYNNGVISWKFKPIFYQRGSHQKGIADDNELYAYRDWNYVNASVGGNATKQAKMKNGGAMLDDSYQMQLFAPGVYEDDYVYANVFMWDEMWVRPQLNGSPMTRVTKDKKKYSYSEYIQTNYYHSKANWYSDVDFNNCFSVFKGYIDPNEPHSATVTVQDRFGKTYSSSITW